MVDLILDAGRLRERWLQADLFLAARSSRNPEMPYFYCNAEVQGYGGLQMRQLLAKRICEPSESAKLHSHGQVLALNKAGRNVVGAA